MQSELSRREFLEFLGRSTLSLSVMGHLSACALGARSTSRTLAFKPLSPSAQDELQLAEGFSYRMLMKWGDLLNSKGESFGFNNDYIDWVVVPGSNSSEIILWVNHESVDPLMMHGTRDPQKRTKGKVITEMLAVGGSLVHLKKTPEGWAPVQNSSYNRRISAQTEIPLVCERDIQGSRTAIGTLANCAGGKTPDGKILTCEENYHDFFGEVSFEKGKRQWRPGHKALQWDKYFPRPPEHYGWVVEVDPFTGKARKLTGLGRFAHECATVTVAADGRWVVYTGDDANDQCLYKFVSSSPGQLEKGTLYVANLEEGRWLPLSQDSNEKLKGHFKDQTDLLIQTRKAAALAGGSLLDRPEDIEIDPVSRNVFVTLTNNKPKGNLHGSILKLSEKDQDPASLYFEAETFLAGGETTGFSCPDNLVFDSYGDLWMTSDISGGSLNKKDYAPFGNNGLFYIPMSGPDAGRVLQVASAPYGAELTGPKFSPDETSLFLAVQHPGENSDSLESLTSHWPLGGTERPRPSIVEIQIPRRS